MKLTGKIILFLCMLLALPFHAYAAEAQTAGNAADGPVIVLDPGHQGSWVDMSAQEPVGPGSDRTKAMATAGTTGAYTGIPEYQVNLEVALALRKELESRGYQVVLTREDNDIAISNKERAQLATKANAAITVRIHANGSEDSSISGALTMAPSAENPYVPELAESSYRLSSCILEHFCETTGLENLGILTTDEMTGINWSTVPVTILEMGFMSNEHDDRYITDTSHHETMAQGIADGIDAYFGIAREADSTEAKAEEPDMEALKELLETTYFNDRQASGETWSAAVLDLNSEASCLIHADQKMQSASVIKLFIMATVYERAVFAEEMQKDLINMAESYDGELKDLLTSMITVSDNDAANELVRRLGQGDFEAGAAIINAFCQEHGFTETHMGRPFLAENPTDDNYTSALDCCNLLAEIYKGSFINEDASSRMLALLKAQTRTGKIPAGVPADVETANKTGEMSAGYGLGSIENDAAIVFDASYPYVICVFSNDIAENGAAQETIVNISKDVYTYLSNAERYCSLVPRSSNDSQAHFKFCFAKEPAHT
ncbi:MAG: N-acetylmuramoyl-L-alanine amidase [Eubacteriales bacterium]|nr:N-acetylmuramoyl-L-alanine amidase [Eubacteriales bacterium]